jgi:hypothetical protein
MMDGPYTLEVVGGQVPLLAVLVGVVVAIALLRRLATLVAGLARELLHVAQLAALWGLVLVAAGVVLAALVAAAGWYRDRRAGRRRVVSPHNRPYADLATPSTPRAPAQASAADRPPPWRATPPLPATHRTRPVPESTPARGRLGSSALDVALDAVLEPVRPVLPTYDFAREAVRGPRYLAAPRQVAPVRAQNTRPLPTTRSRTATRPMAGSRIAGPPPLPVIIASTAHLRPIAPAAARRRPAYLIIVRCRGVQIGKHGRQVNICRRITRVRLTPNKRWVRALRERFDNAVSGAAQAPRKAHHAPVRCRARRQSTVRGRGGTARAPRNARIAIRDSRGVQVSERGRQINTFRYRVRTEMEVGGPDVSTRVSRCADRYAMDMSRRNLSALGDEVVAELSEPAAPRRIRPPVPLRDMIVDADGVQIGRHATRVERQISEVRVDLADIARMLRAPDRPWRSARSITAGVAEPEEPHVQRVARSRM